MVKKLSHHHLGTLRTNNLKKLLDGSRCLNHVYKVVKKHKAQALGSNLHFFPNKSFTIVVSLAESHISIHTWPERQTVQLDVFLCNYHNDNSLKGKNIYNDIVDYFECYENNSKLIKRS